MNAIRPQRTFAIHDAQINDRGLGSVNGWLTEETDSGYRYLRGQASARMGRARPHSPKNAESTVGGQISE